jgi:uncharacterized membrane protein YciS (DUF1049 family)
MVAIKWQFAQQIADLYLAGQSRRQMSAALCLVIELVSVSFVCALLVCWEMNVCQKCTCKRRAIATKQYGQQIGNTGSR